MVTIKGYVTSSTFSAHSDGFVCLGEQRTGSNSVFLEGAGGSWRMAQQGGTCIQSPVHARAAKMRRTDHMGKGGHIFHEIPDSLPASLSMAQSWV